MSSQHPVDEKWLDDKVNSGFLRALPCFKNQHKSYYLQLEEIFMQYICYIYLLNIYAVYYVVIYEG